MANLVGKFDHSMDDKGRMSVPNKFRELLGAEFYLCIGHNDSYVCIYSPEEFEKYQEKLYTIPGRQGDITRRKLLSSADRQVPDKQGRIFVKQELRDHAFLNKEVVVIGAGHRVEIWDKDKWYGFDESVTLEDISDSIDHLIL